MSVKVFQAVTRRSAVAAGLLVTAFPVLAKTAPGDRPRRGGPGWPSPEQWDKLRSAVNGRLAPVTSPTLDPASAPKLLANPYFIRDQAGLTQSSGYLDAWRSAPSAFAVRPASAADVSAAVRFAARHRLRVVVKGGGHSYLGGSSAPDSLLIWTRDLDRIEPHPAFTPAGSSAAPIPAVSLGAGCIWREAYEAVTGGAGRYVQGGGCTTVGVAGLVQGGGFGSFSKTFGSAAASLLEAEIVTADGAVRIVSEARDPDLFWALKGGGGGTFGVVTRLTLATHALPATFGVARWSVTAKSDAAFLDLLERFTELYADRLFNAHWGEQASARPRNRFEIQMLFQGLDTPAARESWRPLADFVASRPSDYHTTSPLLVIAIPARKMWDLAFLDRLPGVVATDDRPGGSPTHWWWAGNTEEAGTFWHGYQSLWLPADLLRAERRAAFAKAWFDASRHWSTSLHFNKGLAGAPPAAIAASRATATNPQVLDAFALAIIAMDGPSAYAPLPTPDLSEARDNAARIDAAMAQLRKIAPAAGSYMSECDYHLPNWQAACWGPHASRLAAIKRRYDPRDLFIVHHGVGSERWSADGFTRAA